ncbi:glycosyltransferase [Serinicoccus kebangsaanensis]|uniref:glycosyltransferase n=1 Tax=Serinicoccus kebangsaanensis TaxID=2602069 RepID=UPI00178C647E|nr:glycosyltransferase [Serinicoccus kebangsaanensis]
MVGRLRSTPRRVVSRVLRSLRSRATEPDHADAVQTPAPPPGARRGGVPELSPPPDVLHVVLVEGIPLEFGGRTASILSKCRTLYELGGIRSVVLVRNHAHTLPRAIEGMRRRGQLSEGVEIRWLMDAYPDATESAGPAAPTLETAADLERAGWVAKGGNLVEEVDGRPVRLRRFRDDALDHEHHFDDQGYRVRRDEFDHTGRLRRTIRWEPGVPSPSEQVFYRRNGRPMYSVEFSPPPQVGSRAVEESVTVYDEDGRPESTRRGTMTPIVHRALDAVIGTRPTILAVEARQADADALAYTRDHVRTCFVAHNSHLKTASSDLDEVRAPFRRLFRRQDSMGAMVFLTERQRADAEAYLGRQDTFWVMPHAAPGQATHADVQPDPDLVIMMGRLADQKRTDHGIRAFAAVVEQLPGARLEIFGEGERRAELQQLIDDLGLQDSVSLQGFTTQPGREYRRATLVLQSSKFEGAPIVFVEALRQQCPIVSYDIRYGPADIIDHGVNGFLVEDADIDGLAERVVQVLSDPDLAASLRAGCAGVDERFGERAFAARWFELFRSLYAQMPPSVR